MKKKRTQAPGSGARKGHPSKAKPKATSKPPQTRISEASSVSPLAATLALAVPLWIERVRSYPVADRTARAHECAQHIAEHGDKLMFGGKPGQAANAFNRLAEGLACAAFAPGGVRFMGMRFDAEKEPPEDGKYLKLADKASVSLLREALLAFKSALHKEWEMALTVEKRGERVKLLWEEIARVDDMLHQIGYTSSGPREDD